MQKSIVIKCNYYVWFVHKDSTAPQCTPKSVCFYNSRLCLQLIHHTNSLSSIPTYTLVTQRLNEKKLSKYVPFQVQQIRIVSEETNSQLHYATGRRRNRPWQFYVKDSNQVGPYFGSDSVVNSDQKPLGIETATLTANLYYQNCG